MTRFVFIDNDPESVMGDLRDALGDANVGLVSYPGDFDGHQAAATKARLDECSVVLMDLDLYGNDVPIFSLSPRNGLALEETIKGWLADVPGQTVLPKHAYVLFSHELGKVAGVLGLSGREHVIARATGNEWVTSKNAADRGGVHKDLKFLETLASAVEGLPDTWANGEGLRDQVMEILGIQSDGAGSWRESASEDIERYRIPLQSIGEGVGLSLIRWLLHVVLPFPSCLVPLSDIALMLRIDPEYLGQNADARQALEQKLEEYSYTGPLRDFLGPRWWTVGVSRLRGVLLEEARAAGHALPDYLGVKALPSEVTHPVPIVDNRFIRTAAFSDVAKCVRVLSDDWPEEIDHPWMAIDTVMTTQRLIALVHPEDRYRLPD